MRIAPSLIASDLLNIKNTLKELESLGITALHLDVMDGQFVPEITIGANFVEQIKKRSSLELDVHLMVMEPDKHIQRFLAAGADYLSFQLETARHPYRMCQEILDSGKKPGVAINPGTPVEMVFPLLPVLNQVTIMTVNPGYSRQKMIYECLNKIKSLKECLNFSPQCTIKVDGGVHSDNIGKVVSFGANWAVVGGALFNDKPIAENYTKLIQAIKSGCPK